ncbi:hypothetical protein [Streptomyces aureoverticillatus]|uniref:hypothetical protein n=1 Tax=Streptomyces aureoverticillatus TaxID=66871 RepID=UPI0013DA3750|nr:hypothetical protein [Streptomyces aureoverticillatus]QIB43863.1 hypothetical protein G3H79_12935 [Streptomyces aureoverticillatus]
MAVSRRNLLRSAAAVVPALALGSALPGGASAAGGALPEWRVFPFTTSSDWYGFKRLAFAPGGGAMAAGSHYHWDEIVKEEPAAFAFDGTDWKSYEFSKFPKDTRPLTGISVGAADDVWAVGERINRPTMLDEAQILHWDGTAWSDRTGSAGSAIGRPEQIDGTGGALWVVGNAKYPATGAVALRRSGSAWTSVPLPATLGAHSGLLTVRVVAADDVWVGGYTATEARGTRTPLVMHWNGTAWKVLPTPFGSAVGQVSALLVRDGVCWAGGAAGARAAVATWSGGAWSLRSPEGQDASAVTQLAAYGAEVWSVGTRVALQRWTGASWSAAPSPTSAPLTSGALANGPDGSLWLAGSTSAAGGVPAFFAQLPAAA